MKKQLWNKAFDAMRKHYGNPAPIEIMNRLLTEHAEMQNTDMIVYFNLLSVLATEAKKQGEHIRVRGGTGVSFVAYLLGATEINPLKPHYYCSECGTVIFDNSVDDGWDLPGKSAHAEKKCKRMDTIFRSKPIVTWYTETRALMYQCLQIFGV